MGNGDYKKTAEAMFDISIQLWTSNEELRQERDELVRQLCEDTFSFTSWLQGLVSGAVIIGLAWAVTCLT